MMASYSSRCTAPPASLMSSAATPSLPTALLAGMLLSAAWKSSHVISLSSFHCSPPTPRSSSCGSMNMAHHALNARGTAPLFTLLTNSRPISASSALKFFAVYGTDGCEASSPGCAALTAALALRGVSARHTAASRSIASPPFASAAASASATADAFCCLHAARFRSALRSSRRHRDTTASQISSRRPFLCHARTSRSARTRR